MLVREIMTPRVVRIRPDDALATAAALFEQHRFHHLLVVDGGRLAGVLSDRDLLKNVSPFINKMAERPQDVQTLQRRVHQIMTRQPVTILVSDSIEAAGRRMLSCRVSCLPVVDENQRLRGIVTWRDLLRGLCGEAQPLAA